MLCCPGIESVGRKHVLTLKNFYPIERCQGMSKMNTRPKALSRIPDNTFQILLLDGRETMQGEATLSPPTSSA